MRVRRRNPTTPCLHESEVILFTPFHWEASALSNNHSENLVAPWCRYLNTAIWPDFRSHPFSIKSGSIHSRGPSTVGWSKFLPFQGLGYTKAEVDSDMMLSPGVRPVHHLSPEFSTIIKCLLVFKQPKQTNWNQAFNEIALPENPLICIKQTNQSSTTSKDNESIFQSNESSKPMITTPLISNQTQQTMPLKHFIPSLINNHQLNHKQNHHQPKKHEPSMKTPVGRWSN